MASSTLLPPLPEALLSLPKPLQASSLSESDLAVVNSYLSPLTPQEILLWGLSYLPNLHQTTAFGLTGLVANDMLQRLERPVDTRLPPLIFIDTLYHFQETYDLVEQVERRYGIDVNVYKPAGCETVGDFEEKYGPELWKRDENLYDFAVKVEPARRAYAALNVQSVITGRRASQGGARATLQPLEVDSTGLFKLNPLCTWNFHLVEWYATSNDVPRNVLLQQGYKSIGDWHSTVKSGEGDAGERAGRWAGRDEKTECGLHEDYFEMKAKARAEVQEKAPEDGGISASNQTITVA